MKLHISNLGAISEAEIDLSKDLIILCGQNNSGKTYAAYTVYSLNWFNINEEDIRVLIPYNINDWSESVIKIDIGNYFEKWRDYIVESIQRRYPKLLYDVFAAQNDIFAATKIQVTLPPRDTFIATLPDNEMSELVRTHNNNSPILFQKPQHSHYINITIADRTNLSDFALQNISQSFLSYMLFDFLIPNMIIFPTERTALNIFSKELSLRRNNLIDEMLKLSERNEKGNLAEVLEQGAKRYIKPIRDNLAIAEDLAQLSKNKSEFAWLAEELERTISGGKVGVSSYGEMQFKPKNSKNFMEIHLAGSMVKSLAGLVFYLRHIAKQGDCIIIDEPELNLHPDNQRRIAKFLVKVVNSGFKVIMSTHSDYIIREINNMIMLSQSGAKAEKLRKKFKYPDTISPDRLGVYLFPVASGNKPIPPVQTLEVTEQGFAVETIDKEINDLNTSTDTIYFNLFEEMSI